MSEENVEFVRRLWADAAGQDLVALQRQGAFEGYLEDLDPEIEVRWQPVTPDVEIYRGHAGFLRAIEVWLDAWEDFYMDPADFIDRGDSVVVLFTQHGRGKASGVDVRMEGAQVYTVRAGKLRRLYEYASKEEALEAAEPAE